MIGSPDLLAFTGGEGFREAEEQETVPEELTVPLLPAGHPWSSSARFNRDFILVAEFSEQVGPKPVLTIPDDPRIIGSFDLNHFSVRIMSVDYQASGPGPSPGPRLNFSEDSKVILGDSAEDAFAYVHHLTLYDLEARGMVRPFCMAYVCSDQAKLTENFSELSTCFSQASDSLKTGNRQAFSKELQRKLQELEFGRLTLLQETERQRTNNSLTDVEEKGDELEAVERSILTHRDLLRQVTSYPNRKLKQPDFLPYDPADCLSDPTVFLLPEPSSSSLSNFYKSERCLKPLQELCNSYFLSLMKDQLAATEQHLRGDRSVLRTSRVAHSLSRRLTITDFLFEVWRPEDGEEEEWESTDVEAQMALGSKRNAEEFQSDRPTLETFFSCVEELPIKLEAGEAGSSEPGVGTEMTGSISSGDSIEVLTTEKSYHTQHAIAGSDSRETAVSGTDAYLRRVAVDTGIRHVRAYAKRANSEDSIEVLSTTESIFPDDLTAITEEEVEQQPLNNGFEPEEEPQTDCRSDEDLTEEKRVNEDTLVSKSENESFIQALAETEESSTQITVGDGVMIKEKLDIVKEDEDKIPEMSKLLQGEATVKSKPQQSEVHLMRSMPDLHLNIASSVDRWPPSCPPLRLPSIDEASDCTSFTGSSEPPSPTQNLHSNADLHRRRRKAGLRALRFIKQNSFSQHAVFCLLSGRPLVVVGGNQSLVRKLVDALSLFLPAPGPDGGAVMPCLTAALQLTDLLTWRLIGIHR
uniref:Guanine nucleotide exchange protein SMCR8-like n=1 Tax=Acanthochromis polyacanthus TaxID=80966 RepID=A0A3Q1I2V3_9TELE